jgi:uncharacterized delta-60 repeat protein
VTIARCATAAAAAALLVTSGPAPISRAAGTQFFDAGALDPSFGTNGRVVSAHNHLRAARAVVVQPDGRVVAAGWTFHDFALARFNADGSPDTTFGVGGDGVVTTDFDEPSDIDHAWAMVLQPDGRIIAGGASESDFALARYTAGGFLDPTFSGNARVTTDFGGDESIRALALQPDGKIIAVGHTTARQPEQGFEGRRFAVARYHPDGSLDTSFGGGDGKVITEFWGQGTAQAFAVVLQSDGKIVAGGLANSSSEAGAQTNDYFGLARYHTDGSLDASFSDNGRSVFDLNGDGDRIHALALQPDGKIVAAGVSGSLFAVARFNLDGFRDETFNGTGFPGFVRTKFTVPAGLVSPGHYVYQEAHAVTVLPNGKILAGGLIRGGNNEASGADFALARYRWDGSLDTTFSNDGKVLTDFPDVVADPPDSHDTAYAMALQPDGKIVLAGGIISLGKHTVSEQIEDQRSFALARYFSRSTKPGPQISWTSHLDNVESGPPAGTNPHGRLDFRPEGEGRLAFRLHVANLSGVTAALVYEAGRTDDDPAGGRSGLRIDVFDAASCRVENRNLFCEGVLEDAALIERWEALVESGQAHVMIATEENPLGQLRGVLRGGSS